MPPFLMPFSLWFFPLSILSAWQALMVPSVKWGRWTKGCWTSTANWAALRWQRWKAFLKTSSSWGGAYEPLGCVRGRERKMGREGGHLKGTVLEESTDSVSTKAFNVFAIFSSLDGYFAFLCLFFLVAHLNSKVLTKVAYSEVVHWRFL